MRNDLADWFLRNKHFNIDDSGTELGTHTPVKARFWPWLETLSVRALPTETKVESGTSQSKSGTSVSLSNSGCRSRQVRNDLADWFLRNKHFNIDDSGTTITDFLDHEVRPFI